MHYISYVTFLESVGHAVRSQRERRGWSRRELAGASGVYPLEGARQPPLVVASGEGLVGITFDPTGALVVASNDTVYGFVNTAAAPSTAH